MTIKEFKEKEIPALRKQLEEAGIKVDKDVKIELSLEKKDDYKVFDFKVTIPFPDNK